MSYQAGATTAYQRFGLKQSELTKIMPSAPPALIRDNAGSQPVSSEAAKNLADREGDGRTDLRGAAGGYVLEGAKIADHVQDRRAERTPFLSKKQIEDLRAAALKLELEPGPYHTPLKNHAGNLVGHGAFRVIDGKLVMTTILSKDMTPKGTSLSHVLAVKTSALNAGQTVRPHPQVEKVALHKQADALSRAVARGSVGQSSLSRLPHMGTVTGLQAFRADAQGAVEPGALRRQILERTVAPRMREIGATYNSSIPARAGGATNIATGKIELAPSAPLLEQRATLEHELGERKLIQRAHQGVPVTPFGSHFGPEARVREYTIAGQIPEDWQSALLSRQTARDRGENRFTRAYAEVGGTAARPVPPDSRQSRALARNYDRWWKRLPNTYLGDERILDAAVNHKLPLTAGPRAVVADWENR